MQYDVGLMLHPLASEHLVSPELFPERTIFSTPVQLLSSLAVDASVILLSFTLHGIL